MSEFDKTSFENLMNQGVVLHVKGEYESGFFVAENAYTAAPDNSNEQGRAARDMGARLDRMGKLVLAREWSDRAYRIHDDIVRGLDNPTRNSYRERSVSAMYLAVSGIRTCIEQTQVSGAAPNDTTLGLVRQTWADLQAAKAFANGVNKKVDQYEINAARRISIAEIILGERRKGITIGLRGLIISSMSESPCLDTSTPNLKLGARLKSKSKALVGSVSALTVGMLFTKNETRRKNMALKIANRTL